ncbi:Ift122 protein [Thecamonas trahens ATCC 50062]|uniref:Intraflagellar transport protein 122 homolog n=1 Tax=Thecamonas trahens ATCC 50062 TaxID=461836 RepID=A0A0L0D7E7_THETB|nr:Ift122 protein [Thecamonas trahens ATCC 50062]KNC48011.1 Ift122 protein [Thecamonas trahens ATCC 50062]|eukprot:XP_013759026.1 Ift122 protein [Thecamonas trahens ATCC 50062]
MSSQVVWDNKVRNMEGVGQPIYGVAFQPTGPHLVAAVGHRVLVYDMDTGELVKGLKGHKAPVYCVAYSRDGTRFASGSADKHVIIWTSELQGILRYKHHEPVYCMAYNPVSQQLASCTGSDFGLWSPERNEVDKTKVSSRVVSCAWTPDGQNLALGMWDGTLSIRNKDGEEVVSVSRGTDPVWCLAWRPSLVGSPVLAVGDWSQKLSFYSVTGRQLGREVELGFDPTSLAFWNGDDEYMLIGGSNSALSLYSREGVALGEVVGRDGWVWAAAHRAETSAVAIGTADGSISLHDVTYSTVHGLHQQTYAARKAMTSVTVQDLITEDKTLVPVRDHVLKLAVYTSRLAVQTPSSVVVYELYGTEDGVHLPGTVPSALKAGDMEASDADSGSESDGDGIKFRELARLDVGKTECSLLVVTAEHVVLCHERSLVMFGFDGSRLREWNLASLVRYVKVLGGPVGGEGLLVGMRSGEVVKVFVNSPFPVKLIDQGASIRCLDLSQSRMRLAVVDEHHNLMVYSVTSGELEFSEADVNSVAFNAHHEDMLAYSTRSETIFVKAGKFPAIPRKQNGFVVGFMGSRLFCLDALAMKPIEVPQSGPLHQYLSVKDFGNAYAVACLGVTEADWSRLAHDALINLELGIARKAFTRIRELRYIELVDSIERQAAIQGADDSVLMAHILAFQGKIAQAGKLYQRANKPQLALDMYVDLGELDEAEQVAAKYGIPMEQLMKKREASVVGSGDWRALVELYHSSGQHDKVVSTIAEALAESAGGSTGDKLDMLAQVVGGLSAQEKGPLREAAKLLRAHEQYEAALEAYEKLGDVKSLVELHVKLAHWKEAFAVVADVPAYAQDVYVPYAEWLLERDEFEAAIKALGKSGSREKSIKLLEALITNAVSERRFGPAAHYYWWLGMQYLSEVKSEVSSLSSSDKKKLKKFSVYYYKAEIYYAFQFVSAYIDEPFNPHLGSQDAVFNITRYLLTRIERVAPRGVSKVYTLIALARLGLDCGAYNLARSTLDKLTALVVPSKWLYELDAMAIATRSKLNDEPTLRDLHPRCARCGALNALVPRNGACATCHHEFQVSFYSFDTLPLVEFVLPDSISADAAKDLIRTDSLAKTPLARKLAAAQLEADAPAVPTFTLPGNSVGNSSGGSGSSRRWRESARGDGGAQTLSLASGAEPEDGSSRGLVQELFGDQLMAVTSSDTYVPFVISRAGLAALDASQVLVREWACPAMRAQFYLNITPAFPVYACAACNHVYHEADYELHILESGLCPMCTSPFKDNVSGGSGSIEDLDISTSGLLDDDDL